MELFINLIFVFLFAVSSAQRSPTISFISKEKVVNIGDTVELECTVQYAQDYSVVWLKTDPENPSDNLFISSGTNQIVPGDRYTVRHDDNTGTFILKISKIQEIDAGLYECQIIIGPNSKQKNNVWLYVRLPPVISDNSTRSVITSTGSSVEMHCYATGYPPPRISWRRENNDLLPNGYAFYAGNTFAISNITKFDRGTYYCVADNGVGKGARRNIGLEVEFRPYVTIERPRYGQALQYDQILECHVEAFPSPSIVWIKDNMQLNDNQHYQISIHIAADEFTDTTLRIITAEKRQYGYYTCKATNKLGSHEKVIEFFETPNVICPPACGVDLYRSSSKQLSSWFCLVLLLLAATLVIL
ncbi:lachesin-like isoform X2 [Uloborus diversus]|uniref:lachesin-like isoform X2 n=1 Tax=Uloborus diversus TaxID=327109 RepID=UPI0024095C0E|nr:lachesin-like isoform X2 [Uloborus diversus]